MSVTAYESKETGIKILSADETIEPDLIELANSGLIDKNIRSFGKDSFAFQTDNILLPSFIHKNFATFKSVVGINYDAGKITFAQRKEIFSQFMNKLSSPDKLMNIRGALKIEEIVKRLRNNNKDNIAEIVGDFFSQAIANSYSIDISLYETDSPDELFFKMITTPKLTMESVLEDYIQAVIFENKLYRTRVGCEKLSFCPIDSSLGSQIIYLIDNLNSKLEQLNEIIVNEFIETLEQVLQVSLDQYYLEINKVDGIDVERNSVSYFQNVSMPLGTVGISASSREENTLYLCSIDDAVDVKFLPSVFSIDEYKKYFKEYNILKKLCNLV